MKKICVTFLLVFIGTLIFASPAENLQELVLENGLTVFLLEDSSDALIHTNFVVKAGFSDQTPHNTGFFTLYNNLIKSSIPQIKFQDSTCTSDSTYYKFSSTPLQFEEHLESFSKIIFSAKFSDDLIEEELSSMKNQVLQNSTELSFLINSAIDSKVFSAAPWKHDSGIYPALFRKLNLSQTRSFLNDISNAWYTPQNSAIFICGNINIEKTLLLLNSTFGKYYCSNQKPEEKKYVAGNQQKRYVIHDPEISKDLTQVVVQYTMLNMEETDILAAALDYKYSSFKKNILNMEELNIPGDEYINVALAHKHNSSRLIFQTLIQPSENNKIKTNSLKQSLKFLDEIQNIPQHLEQSEFEYAKKQLKYNFEHLTGTSKDFMDNLADFWTIEPFIPYYSDAEFSKQTSISASKMLNRNLFLDQTDFSDSIKKFSAETPYIFVIINSQDFKTHKKEYLAAGFEEITSKNSSWYVQKLHSNQKFQFSDTKNYDNYNSFASSDNQYFNKNISSIQKSELSNNIKVITKINKNTTGLSIIINLNGGKYITASDNGFEEVMTNLLGTLIQKEIYNRQLQGFILGAPTVTTNTDLFTSQILIEADSYDFDAICSAVAKAIVYGEISPASADRAVSSRQYKKRLENGSAVNQMYCEVINKFFPKTEFSKIYEAKNEILLDTTYTKILEAYPSLINSKKYDFIICGHFESHEKIQNTMEHYFGNLESTKNISISNLPEIKKQTKKIDSVKIIHTFLTDIPAEKAGPQPAVLIPTTEFLDPAIYILLAPTENLQQEAIFYSVLNYLEVLLQQEIDSVPRLKGTTVQIQLPKAKIPFGSIIFTNVSHTKEIEAVYKSAIQKLTTQISENPKKQIQEIKNLWLLKQLEQTSTNSGTALLIQKGFEFFPEAPLPEYYLNQYNYIWNASVQEFQEILEYFPLYPELRLYSKDSKN